MRIIIRIDWTLRFLRAPRCFSTLSNWIAIIVLSVVIVLVLGMVSIELGQGIANILQLHDRTFFSKVKGVDLDGANESGKFDLLEFVVNEVLD